MTRHPHARPTAPLRAATLAALALSAALLAACGGGDDDPAAPAAAAATQVTLSGTAATGAAIGNGEVVVTNALGQTATVRTGSNGSFSVAIGEGAPYLLRVTDAGGTAWYSYAQQPGTVNITPLTTLALLEANGHKPLADLAKSWADSRLSADAVLAAAAEVNAHLRTQMAAAGLDADRYNIFSTAFNADHTGYDALLDAVRVSIDCSATQCTQTLRSPAGSVLVQWDGDIATTGIALSWTATGSNGGGSSSGAVTVGLGSCKAPVAGTYSMVVQTAVAGVGAGAVPEVCIDGLPGAPASRDEFCGGSDAAAQLPPGAAIRSCSYGNNVGTIVAQISTGPITVDYTVTYTFVKR